MDDPTTAEPSRISAAELPHPRTAGMDEVRRLRRSSWGVGLVVVVLLGFYAAMTFSAAWQKGLSFDEGEHIGIGYDMWLRGDFRMETANGDLVKRWATLPLLFSRPNFVATDDPSWLQCAPYEVGFWFFFREGNDPHALLMQCRAMIVLVGMATGLLIFFCSRALFGALGGLVSLFVFVTSPSMLAFGGIVCTEMTTCFTLLGATWCLWRLLWRVTWRRLLASLAFAGLLVLSKPTAVVMFPVAAILIAVKLAWARPLHWQVGAMIEARSRRLQAALFGVLVAVHVLVAWLCIWTAYDFRYAASPDPHNPRIIVATPVTDEIDPMALGFLRWSRRTHFLPEGYTRGIQVLLGQNESQPAFMDGEWKYGGWRTFFPYAMWIKTQPPFFGLLVVLAAAGAWMLRRRRHRTTADGAALGPVSDRMRDAVPFLVLIVVYFGAAIMWDMNIGFRHALPMYPAAFVLLGGVAVLWRAFGLVVRTTITALLAWHLYGPLSAFPHYLAYFSPVAGGPAQGYTHLVDSSLDWGMDLPGLQHWLAVNNPGAREPFFFGYFGVGNPDFYHIISYRLPGYPDWRFGPAYPLRPGIYAISATLLQGVGTRTFGPWNKEYEDTYWKTYRAVELFDRTESDPVQHAALLAKYPSDLWNDLYARYEALRFGRLCAWLRHNHPPDDTVGHSILIWRLTAEELSAAALGPPAELADQPLPRPRKVAK